MILYGCILARDLVELEGAFPVRWLCMCRAIAGPTRRIARDGSALASGKKRRASVGSMSFKDTSSGNGAPRGTRLNRHAWVGVDDGEGQREEEGDGVVMDDAPSESEGEEKRSSANVALRLEIPVDADVLRLCPDVGIIWGCEVKEHAVRGSNVTDCTPGKAGSSSGTTMREGNGRMCRPSAFRGNAEEVFIMV